LASGAIVSIVPQSLTLKNRSAVSVASGSMFDSDRQSSSLSLRCQSWNLQRSDVVR
jgi:hypothetical protein